MRLTIDHAFTANGKLMLSEQVRNEVRSGINDPSDAIIPAETSLYRMAHRFIEKAAGRIELRDEQACASPWWSTYYDFNKVTWASSEQSQSEAGRAAFAIHRGWGGDCSRYASIVTTTDLSVWYGLGRAVEWTDLGSPQMSFQTASDDILQIYIPGMKDNALKWSRWRRVIAFPDALSNGRGFQGDLPRGLRPPGSTQLSLFGEAS